MVTKVLEYTPPPFVFAHLNELMALAQKNVGLNSDPCSVDYHCVLPHAPSANRKAPAIPEKVSKLGVLIAWRRSSGEANRPK